MLLLRDEQERCIHGKQIVKPHGDLAFEQEMLRLAP